MTYIQERGSTHVYHVNRMSKEEMDHMISLCVHDQPAYCVAACPFKVDTKEMLFYASKGNFKKALAIYEKITPFPMVQDYLCCFLPGNWKEKCILQLFTVRKKIMRSILQPQPHIFLRQTAKMRQNA